MLRIEDVMLSVGMSESKARRVLGVMNRQKLSQNDNGILLALEILRKRSQDKPKEGEERLSREEKQSRKVSNAAVTGKLRLVTQRDIAQFMTFFGCNQEEAIEAILGGVTLN